VARIQAEVDGQEQTIAKIHAQAAGAQAKLLYLLGLDPATQLVSVDRRLVPFDVVDASPPTPMLVNQALTTGPGIQEMEGLLGLIQDSIERSKGASKYLPIFELRMAEGAFGAGPGDTMNWDNRWDLGVQARWNLTETVTVRDRQRVARAKIQQAQLAYQDLRGKLTAGVQEARETIVNGREQIADAERQVHNANRAFDLSDLRLREAFQPTSFSESLLAYESLARAQMNYISAISSYDKAELRLMVLLGPAACHFSKPSN
jgi:outer membrane protein TolC